MTGNKPVVTSMMRLLCAHDIIEQTDYAKNEIYDVVDVAADAVVDGNTGKARAVLEMVCSESLAMDSLATLTGA